MMKNKTVCLRLGAGILDLLILAVFNLGVFFVMDIFKIGILAEIFSIPVSYIVYFTVFEASKLRATVGKKIFNIKVCSEHGRRIKPGAALLRSVVSFFTTAILGVGFWIAFIDDEGKTLCDYVTFTRVRINVERELDTFVPMVEAVNAKVKEKVFYIPNNGLTFGRDEDNCNVIFDKEAPAISRCHCSLNYNKKAEAFILEDLFSSYGTFVNSGDAVVPGKITVLYSGDRFYLGSPENTFKVIGGKNKC